MPTRNRVKRYATEQYYHVYNRGVNKQPIFLEPEDHYYFLNLFKRYLSPDTDQNVDKYHRKVANFHDEVELIAFCLMKNHYHLLCYLKEPEGLVHLMRSVMTGYSMYFNRKYKRSGTLYQGVFLASTITTDVYLWHVSRYIHLNPVSIGKDFKKYPYSSMEYYLGKKHADWLSMKRLVETSEEQKQYKTFVEDYEEMQREMDQLKHLLAAE